MGFTIVGALHESGTSIAVQATLSRTPSLALNHAILGSSEWAWPAWRATTHMAARNRVRHHLAAHGYNTC